MKLVFQIVTFVLFVAAIILLVSVVREWNYQFDQHGYHTSADGMLHRESESERNFFLLVLSVLLLIPAIYISFKKSVVRQAR